MFDHEEPDFKFAPLFDDRRDEPTGLNVATLLILVVVFVVVFGATTLVRELIGRVS